MVIITEFHDRVTSTEVRTQNSSCIFLWMMQVVVVQRKGSKADVLGESKMKRHLLSLS